VDRPLLVCSGENPYISDEKGVGLSIPPVLFGYLDHPGYGGCCLWQVQREKLPVSHDVWSYFTLTLFAKFVKVAGSRVVRFILEDPSMEVLLRESVAKLGNRGEVVKVKPGFARNYLLPKRIAVTVTPGNIKQLAVEKRNYDKKLLESKTVADSARAAIEAMELTIPKRAADNGQLFGSVTRQEIASLLAGKGVEVERRKLEAPHIKELGEYEVRARLHTEVVAAFKVTITRIED